MGKAFLVAAFCAATACNSGNSPPSVDAPGSGSGSNHGTVAFGSDCNTVSDTSTECASGVCTNTFNMFPTPVCSVKCTMLGSADDAECPNGSMGMKCNQQGYCRP
ncbi:MAG TPA: hypothetical protein VGL61_12045 [Kofleriaceae bacterium]